MGGLPRPAGDSEPVLVVRRAGYTIVDSATAQYAIVPTSYVLRTSWTDINGVTYPDLGGYGAQIGDLWRGASAGPTWDGRLGIDVAVPTETLITTYNPRSVWGRLPWLLVQDGGGLYGGGSAASAANPLMAGIIALMLEKNPNLDAAMVKSILRQTARRDQFTVPAPNPNRTWRRLADRHRFLSRATGR